ncbi:hypothetical protein FRC00_007483 [Tulasnella sp. 408]|nr:hypothetical protein FRC00_007483 [Tulasnella sp. 408]
MTRKVVVSTNIAEASVTIDGIKFVVDCGFVKIRTYNAKTTLSRLTIVPTSRASATQRAGRAGRTSPGICFRLYPESAFNDRSIMPNTTPPEIVRTDLTMPILQLKALGIDDLVKFEWVTNPPAEGVLRALEALIGAGMVGEDGRLTVVGEKVAEWPVEVNIARALFSSKEYKCSEEMLTIAAMVSVQDVFVIPEGGSAGALAELERRKFTAEEGDHLTLLNGGQQQQQRRPGQPAVPPPAVTTTSPPSSKRRSPPGAGTPASPLGRSSFSDSATLNNTSTTTSPSSTVAEESSTPRKGGRGSGGQKTGYAPQKPSPLAVGAERAKPKEKPKEKSKVNEWGTGFPVSNASSSAPSSPTRSSSSGHGHGSSEQAYPPPPVPPVPSLNVTSSGGRQSANLLALPEPAIHYPSRRDRISVLSDSSYYALDPDEEYGPQDVFMGVALGGDEPSPVPEEYFSPSWDDVPDDLGKSKMERQQDHYYSNRQSDAQLDGYYYQQQSYSQPPSQYQSQGGYGYGGYQQSYRR